MINTKITNKSYFEMESGYFKVPNFLYELAFEMGLNRVERDIYICLVRYANGSTRNPFPSYKKLKKYTMTTRNDTIAKAIRRLEELGLITVISKGTTQGQSNIYKVNYVYPVKVEEPIVESPKINSKSIEESNELNSIDILKSLCDEANNEIGDIPEVKEEPKRKQRGLFTSRKKEAVDSVKEYESVDISVMIEENADILDLI